MSGTKLGSDREVRSVGMRFQARDDTILRTIYEVGGVMAKRHLKEMFWPDKTWRAMEQRLSKLHHNGYLNWPDRIQWRQHPVPESVCWLGWNGALRLGQREGLEVEPITSANEGQLRKLESLLRTQGFHWMREPRWIQLGHDLTVVDFRLLLEKSLRELSSLTLSEWLHEGAFRSHPDVVEYEVEKHGHVVRRAKRGVIPDAFFVIDDSQRRLNGQPYRARFLLEIDNATHDNPSFGMEKALPGAVYVDSPAYQKRFGQNPARWLVVTTAGERRLENLVRQTERRLGTQARLFNFVMLHNLRSYNLIRAPIWIEAGTRNALALLPQ